MKGNRENDFDAFVQKRIKAEALEQPPKDFTVSVVERIEMESKASVLMNYKPLISKYTWLTLSAIILGLLCFLVFGNLAIETAWLPEIAIQNTKLLNLSEHLPKLALSNTYVYAFIGLAFFMGIQVYILKNHFRSTRGLL